jgi:hypothetical protein
MERGQLNKPYAALDARAPGTVSLVQRLTYASANCLSAQ